jgi:ubiquinol-cytochrome c reductase cytochrome c1 subunit
MVRILGFLVGLGFVGVAAWSLLWGVIAYIDEPPVETAEHAFHEEPRDVDFSFEGPLGRWDRQQLQRGFQVYRDVCAACHGLNQVAFRSLEDIGYSEAEVRAIADQWPLQVPSINADTGEPATRKAIPADRFPSPYANETAARAANNNALPPDLSLITKARHGGPEYVYSLLTGYRDPARHRNHDGHALPAENRPGEGLHFNPWFPNLNIAMPPPITGDGQVSYADGTAASADQMAQDVSAFLAWAGDPTLESRHRAGVTVLVFLLFLTVLAYLSYRNVWHSAKRAVRITGPLDPVNIAKRDSAERSAGIEG